MTPALEVLVERAYRHIENQPEYLLEHDGGPTFEKADIIVGRLIGLDGEVIDQIFLQDVLPVWRAPVPAPVTLGLFDNPFDTMLRTVDFVLQSNYATGWLDPMYAPEGATRDPATLWSKVLCLRYKREPIYTSR